MAAIMLKTDTRDELPVWTGVGLVVAVGAASSACLFESPWVVGDSAVGVSFMGLLVAGSGVLAGALSTGAGGALDVGAVGAAGAGAGAGGGGAAFAP